VQATFAAHLEEVLGWESVYAWNDEIFEPGGTLGRASPNEAVLTRDLRAALVRLNPDLPIAAIEDVLRALTVHDFSRSMVLHNQDFAQLIPVADGRRPAMAEPPRYDVYETTLREIGRITTTPVCTRPKCQQQQGREWRPTIF
jgi:hypothetical protein